MNEPHVIGIEIINAEKKGVPILIEESNQTPNITLYQVDNRLIVSPDSKNDYELLISLIEKVAFDIGIDTAKIKLVYIDIASNNIRDSITASNEFKNEEGLDLDDDLPLSLLPNLIDFVEEYSESIADEVSLLEKNNEDDSSPNTTSDENIQNEEDEFIDDVTFTEENIQSTSDSEDVDDIPDDNSSIDSFVQELDSLVQSTSEDDLMHELDNSTLNLNEVVDPLFEQAKILFTNSQKTSIPDFDELTIKELQPSILQAKIYKAQLEQKSIMDIRNRLASEIENALKTVNEHALEDAQHKHHETLEIINKNKQNDILRIEDERYSKYESERERYVQAQIPNLRRNYDKENLPTYRHNLEIEIKEIENKATDSINREEDKFKSYVEKITNDTKERIIDEVDVTDIVSNFNKQIEEQNDSLLSEAELFVSQVEKATEKLSEEKERLTRELNDTKSKLDIQTSTESQRINSEIAMSVSAKEKELEQAHSKEVAELEKQINEMKKNIESEQKSRETLTESLNDKSKEVNNLKLLLQSSHNDINEENTTISKKSHIPSWAIGLGLILLLTLGVSVGLNISSSLRAPATAISAPSVERTTESTISSESTKGLSIGDTFPYTTEKGDKVTVTVDSERSGHYTDKNGNKVTVVF